MYFKNGRRMRLIRSVIEDIFDAGVFGFSSNERTSAASYIIPVGRRLEPYGVRLYVY